MGSIDWFNAWQDRHAPELSGCDGDAAKHVSEFTCCSFYRIGVPVSHWFAACSCGSGGILEHAHFFIDGYGDYEGICFFICE